MKNPDKIDNISNLIKEEYVQHGINSDTLNEIIKLCNELISENNKTTYKSFISNKNFKNIKLYSSINFIDGSDSEEFPAGAKEPGNFIRAFVDNAKFDKKFQTTERIYKQVLEKLFKNSNDKIEIYLGQVGDDIIFCIEEHGNYYRINDVEEPTLVDSQYIIDFNDNFGKTLDSYRIDLGYEEIRNTRKFEITRNVYDYLIKNGFECVLCFPCICMDNDTKNPHGVSYINRYTYMMTFGKITSEYQELPDVAVFDRNGLCPPGNC
ncbi:hypothetical protein J3D55_000894 [Chryseobacterium ginsenosidimutans]|uniref:hypothetical protein n=1 Tax=Chryseobacterium ginsenosidimutans TaxID=687846 RepID=UPI002168F763|nr:hypothetical protein [Chryseobacterium ginsenosidimutans]MCS3867978.1 hypothetical protein [Chryseobacterium ginsenosidimutans]